MVFEAVRQISHTADADIAIRRFVELTANAEVQQVGTQGNSSIGVSMEAADVSENQSRIPIGLLDGGKLEVEAGAAIDVSAGAVPVASDNQGRAIPATGSDRVLGYALSSAGAAGQVVTITGALGPGAATGPGSKFRDTYTTTGGAAAEAITVTGLLSTDVVVVSLRDGGTNTVTIVGYAVAANTLTVTFSGDPGNDAVIDYVAFPQ